MEKASGACWNWDSSEPSEPVVGPEIKSTSTPGFWRRPSTEATVFSWAPPTMSRVMTWVTRMARSVWLTLKFLQPLNDVRGFGGVGVRAGQIRFIILHRLVRLVFAPGDFTQAVGDLERVGIGLLQLQEVSAGIVKVVAVEVGNGAVKE